jgi:two-component system, LytTR family, response regulator
MISYNCIIIEDNEIDRLTIIAFVKSNPIFNIIGAFETPEDALDALNSNKIDVLFLDIEMPKMTGLDVRKKTMEVPVCIFISSYPEHAIESFELDTLDFIVKPLKIDRFNITVSKITDYLEMKNKAQLYESTIKEEEIYIKEGYTETKINIKDILYLEALKDYTKVVTALKKHCVLMNLGNMVKEIHFIDFVRIHKSFAVNRNYIQKKLSQELILTNGVAIPIGRKYKENTIVL